jgi:hypothetical protein
MGAQAFLNTYGDHTASLGSAIQRIAFGKLHVGDKGQSGFSILNGPAATDTLAASVTPTAIPDASGHITIDDRLAGSAYAIAPDAALAPGQAQDYTVELNASHSGTLSDQLLWVGFQGDPNTGGQPIEITGEVVNDAKMRFSVRGLEPDDTVTKVGRTTIVDVHEIGPNGHAPISVDIQNQALAPADFLWGYEEAWTSPGMSAGTGKWFGQLAPGETQKDVSSVTFGDQPGFQVATLAGYSYTDDDAGHFHTIPTRTLTISGTHV